MHNYFLRRRGRGGAQAGTFFSGKWLIFRIRMNGVPPYAAFSEGGGVWTWPAGGAHSLLASFQHFCESGGVEGEVGNLIAGVAKWQTHRT